MKCKKSLRRKLRDKELKEKKLKEKKDLDSQIQDMQYGLYGAGTQKLSKPSSEKEAEKQIDDIIQALNLCNMYGQQPDCYKYETLFLEKYKQYQDFFDPVKKGNWLPFSGVKPFHEAYPEAFKTVLDKLQDKGWYQLVNSISPDTKKTPSCWGNSCSTLN